MKNVKKGYLVLSIFLIAFLVIILLPRNTYPQVQGNLTCPNESNMMCVNITSPLGDYWTNWLQMTENGTSGNTTYFYYLLNYTFCPENGTYNATFYYPYTGVENTTLLYTVNYNSNPNWCYCYGEWYNVTVAWNISGQYIQPYCCGAIQGEYVIFCNPQNETPCTSSNTTEVCCLSSTACGYNGTCYSTGSSITVNGLTYTCNNTIWTNCLPPTTGNWIVGSSCIINENLTVNGSVIVETGGNLIVNNSIITIINGSLILAGGTVNLINNGEILE